MTSSNIHELEQIKQNFSKTQKNPCILELKLTRFHTQNFQLFYSQGNPENKNMSFFSIFNKISKT